MIVDGGVYWLERIAETGMQAYYKNSLPTQGMRVMVTGINIPVRIGKTLVMPGDVVLADREGLWFIPPHMVKDVVESGELSKARDDWSLMMLGTGKYTSRQIYGPLTPELQKQRDDYVFQKTGRRLVRRGGQPAASIDSHREEIRCPCRPSFSAAGRVAPPPQAALDKEGFGIPELAGAGADSDRGRCRVRARFDREMVKGEASLTPKAGEKGDDRPGQEVTWTARPDVRFLHRLPRSRSARRAASYVAGYAVAYIHADADMPVTLALEHERSGQGVAEWQACLQVRGDADAREGHGQGRGHPGEGPERAGPQGGQRGQQLAGLRAVPQGRRAGDRPQGGDRAAIGARRQSASIRAPLAAGTFI